MTTDVAINFMGDQGARVLSTPQMIQRMEITSRNLILPMLEPGYDSVGTTVNIKHVGAAPLGSTVTFRARVLSVDGRRVNFWVEAFDDREKIGEGEHERFVIHIERFRQKMEQKFAARQG